MLAWTPYAIVTLIAAFGNSEIITPLMGTIPAVIAKSSMVWSSLLYILSNKAVRNKVKILILPWVKTKETEISNSRGIF